jgi:hypothetical protein
LVKGRKDMDTKEEALARATGSASAANYPAIVKGFLDRGIKPNDIRPRENVFTYRAWLALGRQVRKGEHGVKILTWVPVPEKVDGNGKVIKKAGMRPFSTSVFHVSQTDPVQK